MKVAVNNHVSFRLVSARRPNLHHTVTRRPLLARAAAAPPDQIEKDFVTELKEVAMSLHTKDKASTGEQEKSSKPFSSWKYTLEGYLRFLAESRYVYRTFERIIQSDDSFALLRDSGLDRVQSLDHDIAWIAEEHDLSIPDISDDSPSKDYAKVLEELSRSNVPAFVCHFFNFYLAHTAGGRMIGKKVADAVLSGEFRRLAFYRYDSNLKQLVDDFKASINSVALDWTREEKEMALAQSVESFKCVGTIMKTMLKEDDEM